MTSPFPNTVAAEVYASSPRQNFIDDLVLDQLRSLNLPPSPRASDEVFVRRAYLDAIGVLPTPAETVAFLEDSSPDKRDRLIGACCRVRSMWTIGPIAGRMSFSSMGGCCGLMR